MTAQPASLGRRDLFRLGFGLVAATGLAGCASNGGSSGGGTPIGPNSPKVAAAERARQIAGARKTSVKLAAVQSEVDLGGITASTWSYGELPGKEIRIRRGDLLNVELRNELPQPTSIHWHGLALRNDMDGVPGLTQDEIPAGQSFTYEFTAPDPGTYWFHPHSGVQLDRGLYAPLIVEDPEDGGNYDTELVIVLDDWLDGLGRTPDAVFDELRANGMPGMDHGAMPGMPAMPKSDLLGGDAGDVIYPHVLANGKVWKAPQTFATKPGQRIRLRLINAGADTAFRVGVPGVPMTVTHADGFPVMPVELDVVLLGMGERLDCVVTVPDRTVPVLALAEGRGQFTQVLLSTGVAASTDSEALATELAKLVVPEMNALRATDSVALPLREPDVTHDLVLEGPGDKYSWTINGKAYDPADGLPIRSGQVVRLRMRNKSKMFHPMHVHGHTFQVRANGKIGPRRDTAIVLPGRELIVDFDADNPGQWLTHCHNVYHGEAGMMAVLSYVE
ncbi:multicopper oxidase family protein [Lentzea albidocapillata]|uniref:Multicopper oxidase with three cupredoxin domains (Includes cell division protein FtsP and spore coat protein CotA) n=1 Tax=Lentzea albidocapillata TaxID=40571 RepID=A0A1W2FUF3_9PSEU|nr:multicopper oxidase family protein [Lentzea albidocapillata]SMD25550.1 Multicopper oxidase with three cupredoxin domains (includes cell division protein FtsP and spore coat protein CotA) [Lentzea albidocapillata]